MDYVDLIFCHRPDNQTPIEETVRAMNFVIDQVTSSSSPGSQACSTDACANRMAVMHNVAKGSLLDVSLSLH